MSLPGALQAERKLRMAALLAEGGFSAEAVLPVDEAATRVTLGHAAIAQTGGTA